MRARFQAVAVAVAVLACGLISGCADTRFETPEATLETAKVAFADHDYNEFCDCLSDDGRDQMAAMMVLLGRFRQMTTKGKGAEEIAAVLKKYGLDETDLTNVNGDRKARGKSQKELFKKIVEPIEDRNAFIVEMIAVIRKHSNKPDNKLFVANAKLTDLKIDGQVATADLVQQRKGEEEKTTPIKFAKNGNQWKIDEFVLN